VQVIRERSLAKSKVTAGKQIVQVKSQFMATTLIGKSHILKLNPISFYG